MLTLWSKQSCLIETLQLYFTTDSSISLFFCETFLSCRHSQLEQETMPVIRKTVIHYFLALNPASSLTLFLSCPRLTDSGGRVSNPILPFPWLPSLCLLPSSPLVQLPRLLLPPLSLLLPLPAVGRHLIVVAEFEA